MDLVIDIQIHIHDKVPSLRKMIAIGRGTVGAKERVTERERERQRESFNSQLHGTHVTYTSEDGKGD